MGMVTYIPTAEGEFAIKALYKAIGSLPIGSGTATLGCSIALYRMIEDKTFLERDNTQEVYDTIIRLMNENRLGVMNMVNVDPMDFPEVNEPMLIQLNHTGPAKDLDPAVKPDAKTVSKFANILLYNLLPLLRPEDCIIKLNPPEPKEPDWDDYGLKAKGVLYFHDWKPNVPIDDDTRRFIANLQSVRDWDNHNMKLDSIQKCGEQLKVEIHGGRNDGTGKWPSYLSTMSDILWKCEKLGYAYVSGLEPDNNADVFALHITITLCNK